MGSHTLRGCVDWNVNRSIYKLVFKSHTLRGCVDWNFATGNIFCPTYRHTLRGCVDWNHRITASKRQKYRHTLRGCVDWNFFLWQLFRFAPSHTLRGCVDWNREIAGISAFSHVTPYVGVWIETLITCFTSASIKSHPAWEYMDWSIVHSSVKFMEEL